MSEPLFYFPFLHGVYDVKAGISRLGKNHGNGQADTRVFQIDRQIDVYRQAKRYAQTRPDQHVLCDHFPAGAAEAIAQWMIERLDFEYPGVVSQTERPSGLDELSSLIQEDFAVLVLNDDGSNRLAYLNVAMPSGWAPEQKIGRPFDAVHDPVPHIESINRKQDSIAQLMVNATRGAVRFAWTITDDAALNHHPHRDRSFAHPTPRPDHQPGQPLLRVERQVIWGFPEHRASLFLIRTYLYDFSSIGTTACRALSRAVSGMSDASLSYKSMDRALILDCLNRAMMSNAEDDPGTIFGA